MHLFWLTAYPDITRQLQNLANTRRISTCAVLTRPPEIICCFYLFGTPKDIFVIFDSHPRPEVHPWGAGFVFKTSRDEMADYLTQLLPFDDRVLEGGVQWQAQLLGNMSGHTLIARDKPSTSVDGDIITASLEILDLKSELLQIKIEKDALAEENKRLKGTVKRYKDAEESSLWSFPSFPIWGPASGTPSKGSSAGSSKRRWETASSSSAHHYPATRANKPPPKNTPNTPSSQRRRDTIDTLPMELAGMDLDPDLEYAIAQQRFYDEENERLAAERTSLNNPGPHSNLGTFECGVCFEEQSNEFVAKIERCHHSFCRNCIRRYLETEVEARKHPIFCPGCVADSKTIERSCKWRPLL